MHIRRAERTDAEALSAIRQRAILGLAVPAMSVAEAEAWAAGAASDRITRAIREHEVWVAVEAVAIGWFEVDRNRVAALYVAPPVSRQGVGSRLLALAETVIRAAGYTTAHLEASQNALGFYLHRGYVQSGTQASDGSWPLTKDLLALV
jgi:GNAT superfamily N-acetyltransferase